MKQVDIRKMVVQKLRQYLENCQPLSNLSAAAVQKNFFQKIAFPQKILSQKSRILLSKIYGTDYRLVHDQAPFESNNNLKALAMAIAQIAFQDPYTTSLLISQLKQNRTFLTKIKNCPFQNLCSPEMLPLIVDYAIRELCFLCLENPDIKIREILSAYQLGLQAFCLTLRAILCKLKYPSAEDYSSQSMRTSTIQLYTIICQYLDISLISKKPKKQANCQVPQLYFFPDYDLFLLTPDNQEFACGIYFENEDLLQASIYEKKENKKFVLKGRNYLDGQKFLRGKYVEELKNSSQYSKIELKTSDSEEAQPFFNKNYSPTTPEFISTEQPPSINKGYFPRAKKDWYHPIYQQQEHLEASLQRKPDTDFSSYEYRNADFFGQSEQCSLYKQQQKRRQKSGNFMSLDYKQNQHTSQEMSLNIDDFIVHQSFKRIAQEENYGSDQSEVFSEERNQDFGGFDPICEFLTLNLEGNKSRNGEAENTPLLTARQLLKEMLKGSKQSNTIENHLKYRGSCNQRHPSFKSIIKHSDIVAKNCLKNSDVQRKLDLDNFGDVENSNYDVGKNCSTHQSPNKSRFLFCNRNVSVKDSLERKTFNHTTKRQSITKKNKIQDMIMKTPQPSGLHKKVPYFLCQKKIMNFRKTIDSTASNKIIIPKKQNFFIDNTPSQKFPLTTKLKKIHEKEPERNLFSSPRVCRKLNEAMYSNNAQFNLQICFSQRINKKKKTINGKFPEFLRNKKVELKERKNKDSKKNLQVNKNRGLLNVLYMKNCEGEMPEFLKTPRQKQELTISKGGRSYQKSENRHKKREKDVRFTSPQRLTNLYGQTPLKADPFFSPMKNQIKIDSCSNGMESQIGSLCQTKRECYNNSIKKHLEQNKKITPKIFPQKSKIDFRGSSAHSPQFFKDSSNQNKGLITPPSGFSSYLYLNSTPTFK